MTPNQFEILSSIRKNTITIVEGIAGTGKNFVSAAEALRVLLSDGKKDTWCKGILCVRPAVGTGNDVGFMPGPLDEKVAFYIEPLRDIFVNLLKKNAGKEAARDAEKMLKKLEAEAISFTIPLYMRGKTLDNSFIILDEAQNFTTTEMKMLLTRIGRRSRVIICGDTDQSDQRRDNGLRETISRIGGLKKVGVVRTTFDDIMRSDIVGDILRVWDGPSLEEIFPPVEYFTPKGYTKGID